MKKDYKADWWLSCEEEKEMSFADLAKGLLFCAAVLAVSMGALYIRGRYFGA